MAIDDNTSYELTGYQVKDLAGRIRRKAEASSVPTSISDLGQVVSSDVDWSTMPGSYSTTEQATPFTWIDDKPIYKKTVYFASVTSGEVYSAHGISDISLVIKHEAFFISGGSYVTIPSLVSTSGGNYFAIWNITPTNVHTFSSIPLQDLYVTLWYTKTTD